MNTKQETTATKLQLVQLDGSDHLSYEPANLNMAKYAWSDKVFQEEFVGKIPKYDEPSLAVCISYGQWIANIVCAGSLPTGINPVTFLRHAVMTWISLDGSSRICPEPLLSPGSQSFGILENAPFISILPLQFLKDQGNDSLRQSFMINKKVVPLNEKYYHDWYTQVRNILAESPDPDEKSEKGLQLYVLHRMIYYVLIICRKITKSNESIERYYLERFNERVTHFWGAHYGGSEKLQACPPPTASFYTMFDGLTVRDSIEVKQLIITLVHILCFQPPFTASLVNRVMKSACMLSFSENGMGLLHWLGEAQKRTAVSISTLYDCFKTYNMSQTISTWTNIISFLHWQNENAEQTWRFARLIDHTTFTFFSTKQASYLTSIFVHLAHSDRTKRNQLMSIPSLKPCRTHLPNAAHIADAILDNLRDINKESGLTTASRAILERAALRKQQGKDPSSLKSLITTGEGSSSTRRLIRESEDPHAEETDTEEEEEDHADEEQLSGVISITDYFSKK